jgi:hypothetical protein
MCSDCQDGHHSASRWIIPRVNNIASKLLIYGSLLITLVDTWLHLTTESLSVDQLEPNFPPIFSFGRRLTPFCAQVADTPASEFPCSLTEGSARLYLINSGEGARTLNNLSTSNQLITVSSSGQTYVFLGDPQALSQKVDFVASTVAMNTQCTPITNRCTIIGGNSGSGVVYNCSTYFTGALSDPVLLSGSTQVGTYFKMTLFNDSALMQPLYSGYGANTTNPVYIAMIALVDQISSTDVAPNGTSIPDSDLVPISSNVTDVAPTYTGLLYILLCNSTIYDATYSWVNGVFDGFTQLTLANKSLARVINAPQQEDPFLGYPYFVSGAILSVFSRTFQEMSDKMALTYSKTVLGLVSGSFIESQNIAETVRTPIIVSSVQYAPFYSLVVINLVCAGLGLGLTIHALRYRYASDVVTLISTWGVVAQAFETVSDHRIVNKMEELFRESRQVELNAVGVEQTGLKNNWRFKLMSGSGVTAS